jgi:hypothetical protein
MNMGPHLVWEVMAGLANTVPMAGNGAALDYMARGDCQRGEANNRAQAKFDPFITFNFPAN